MVGINVERELGFERFEYGQHEISIKVRMEYTDCWSHKNYLNYSVSLRDAPEPHYVRIVEVNAYRNGDREMSNTERVVLDEERKTKSLFGGTTVRHEVVNVRDHIEQAVRPVFESLDELYTYTAEGESIDVDVATHEVKAETSWVEVEDEIERISKEIDALTGDSSKEDNPE